jgi:hypothetical protein
MDAFNYVSVIFSVVIGLGLSHILTGVTDLVKARRRVKFYWIHALWIALIFLGHIFLWWSMWNLRLLRNWNFFSFLSILAAPVLLYVAASFMIPKAEPDERLDLRQYFYENQFAFFGANAAFTALMGAENWLLTGHASPKRVIVVFAAWFVLLCASAVIKNARYHAVISILFTVLFVLFIVVFGLRLGGS